MKVTRIWIIISALVLGVQAASDRARRSAKQFGSMVRAKTTLTLSDLNGYGNYCGFRGSGTPVDNIDRCCAGHDRCLKYSNRKYCSPLFYFSFFLMPYRWQRILSSKFDLLVCSSTNSRCQRGLCECDRETANCLALFQNEYNPAFKKKKRLYII